MIDREAVQIRRRRDERIPDENSREVEITFKLRHHLIVELAYLWITSTAGTTTALWRCDGTRCARTSVTSSRTP